MGDSEEKEKLHMRYGSVRACRYLSCISTVILKYRLCNEYITVKCSFYFFSSALAFSKHSPDVLPSNMRRKSVKHLVESRPVLWDQMLYLDILLLREKVGEKRGINSILSQYIEMTANDFDK